MKVQVVGQKRKRVTAELTVVDMISLVIGYRHCLANPEATIENHNAADEAIEILTKEIHLQLSKQGFADPAGIVEILTSHVLEYREVRRSIERKLVDLRNSPLAYYSGVATRFVEPEPQPPCYWPNYSSDAE